MGTDRERERERELGIFNQFNIWRSVRATSTSPGQEKSDFFSHVHIILWITSIGQSIGLSVCYTWNCLCPPVSVWFCHVYSLFTNIIDVSLYRTNIIICKPFLYTLYNYQIQLYERLCLSVYGSVSLLIQNFQKKTWIQRNWREYK